MKSMKTLWISSALMFTLGVVACSEKKGEQAPSGRPGAAPGGSGTPPDGNNQSKVKEADCDISPNKLDETNKFFTELNKVDSFQLFRNSSSNSSVKLTNAVLSADGSTAFVQAASEASSFRMGDMDSRKNGISAVFVYARVDSKWVQQAKLESEDKRNAFHFGKSLSASADGNVVVIGAPFTAINGYSENSYQGMASIFRRKQGVWTRQASLSGRAAIPASSQNDMSGFAESVAISADGKTVLVSADLQSKTTSNEERTIVEKKGSRSFDGAVYVYAFEENTWKLQDTLTLQTAQSGAQFGAAIALSHDGKQALVSSFETIKESESLESIRGIIHMFKREGKNWVDESQIYSRKFEYVDNLKTLPKMRFAYSLDGKTVVLSFISGNVFDLEPKDSIENFVVTRTEDGEWSEPAELVVSDQIEMINKLKNLKLEISSDGNTVAIGYGDANNKVCNTSYFGTTYIFARKDGVWSQQARLVGRDVSLSADGSKALLTVQESNQDQFSSYLFEKK